MGEYARMADEILEHLGLDPYETRMDKNNWTFDRGSASIIMSIFEPENDEELGYIAVFSPIVKLPKDNLAGLYRFLLERNYMDTKHARFYIKNDVVSVGAFRFAVDTDPRELLALITDVAAVADGADDHLIKEFGAIKFEFGKDEL